jgi:hypothetical protein
VWVSGAADDRVQYGYAANHLYNLAQAARLRATEASIPVTWPRRQWAFRLQTPLRALTEAMLDAIPSVLYSLVDLIP